MRAGHWARLAAIGLGTLLGPLDAAVNIAFPDITSSFAIPLQSIQWVVIAYVATYASLMLIFGRLGDLFGHVHIFQFGLLLSAAAFCACALAREFEWFLVFRFFQGIGTAMVLSCGPALATNLFDETVRPRVLAAYTMMFGLGGAVGPSLGGVLVETWGWPAVFWFRLPVAVLALALVLVLRMPPPPRAKGTFDLSGATLLAAAIGLTLLTFSQLQNALAHPFFAIGLCMATLFGLATYIAHAQRSNAPVLDMRIFSNRNFALINLTNIVVSVVGFSVMLLVPYFLVRASSLPLSLAGSVMAGGPLGMIIAAQFGGRLAQRLGANRIAFVGALLVALGTSLIGFWSLNASPGVLVATLFVHGIGLGLFQVSCLVLVTGELPKIDRGVAGSLVLVMRTVGVVLAASVLTAVFASVELQAAAHGNTDSFLIGFQSTFRLAAIGLFGYLAITCLHPRLWFHRWR